MEELEGDPFVTAWTKQHGIRIPYVDHQSRRRAYHPDFLVRLGSGRLELREVKGTHLMETPDTQLKFEAAKRWCAEHDVAFVVVTKER